MGEEVPLWDWRQFHKTSAKQSERGHWPLPHMQAAEPGTPGGRGALLIGTFFTGAPPPLPTFRGDEQAPLLSTDGQSSTWLTRQGERRRWGCPPHPPPLRPPFWLPAPHHRLPTGASSGSCTGQVLGVS